jgi:hypothetical protein
MYQALIKFIIISSLLQLGLSFKDLLNRPNEAKKRILRIDWKPISIFPEEARRLR